jgi:hypothetical protein
MTDLTRREFLATAAVAAAASVADQQLSAGGGFDAPSYVLDAVTAGVAKGWIMLGHTISEEAGMLEMAEWIKGIVPELPVQLIPGGEPFWAPTA